MSICRRSLIAMCLFSGTFASTISAAQAGPASGRPAPTQVLSDVQHRIGAARLAAATTGDVAGLKEIATTLRGANTELTGQMAYYIPYWLAYSDYLIANMELKAGRKAEASETLSEADTLLTGISSADVETYALLSLVAGLRIAVTTPEKIGEAIGHARDALERAITLDPSNVRVLYARALADYATPKEYGGGRVAERFARSAVERPAESTRGLKPGWVHDDSAALLVRILRASGRDDEAKTILARFAAQYPSSASLHQASDQTKP